MDPVIFTPRLKLTLITQAQRGSPEFEWLHKLRSDIKATWWSIYGQSKSVEDTEKQLKHFLPKSITSGDDSSYRVVYAVHEILDSPAGTIEQERLQSVQQEKSLKTDIVGLVTLISLDAGSLPLPENLTIPATAATTTVTADLGYQFLPNGWGKGYATESVNATLEACKRAQSFWTPFSKLYVRAIVNEGNPASLRVMDKTGMTKRGVYHWTGKPVFLAGEWTERSTLYIFGLHLLE